MCPRYYMYMYVCVMYVCIYIYIYTCNTNGRTPLGHQAQGGLEVRQAEATLAAPGHHLLLFIVALWGHAISLGGHAIPL